MASSTYVLITGGNRGLGLGLAQRFLAQPNQIVITPVRNREHETVKALADLPRGEGTNLIVPTTRYDATSEVDAHEIVKELKEKHGITHLDIVIANVGGAVKFPTVKEAKRSDIQAAIEFNVYSVVTLYQATWELLKSSPGKPSFAIMGSSAGALGRQPPVPNASYGAAKSMLPWYAVRILAEEQWLNAYVIDPGFVQTDQGIYSAKTMGLPFLPPMTVDDCVEPLFPVIRSATRETVGGKVVDWNGQVQIY